MRRLLVATALLAVMLLSPVLAEQGEAAWWNPFPYGQCTWYSIQMRPDLVGSVWGNAWQWAGQARYNGESTGYYPQRGAIVVFQPWTQGSGYYGHVAYVTSVGQNGWFQMAEMNMPYWGRITYRWAQTGYGVSFIY